MFRLKKSVKFNNKNNSKTKSKIKRKGRGKTTHLSSQSNYQSREQKVKNDRNSISKTNKGKNTKLKNILKLSRPKPSITKLETI